MTHPEKIGYMTLFILGFGLVMGKKFLKVFTSVVKYTESENAIVEGMKTPLPAQEEGIDG